MKTFQYTDLHQVIVQDEEGETILNRLGNPCWASNVSYVYDQLKLILVVSFTLE